MSSPAPAGERSTTYKDAAGREHTVAVNIASVQRVRDALGVDLLKLDNEKLVEQVFGDAVSMTKMLFQLIQPRGAWDSFAAAHFGDVMDAAERALAEALIRFFPTRRQVALRKLRAEQELAAERVLAAVERGMESPELPKLVEAEMVERLPPAAREKWMRGNGSGAAPASSASIPSR